MTKNPALSKLIQHSVLIEQSRLYGREAKELQEKLGILIFSKLILIYVTNLYVESQPRDPKLKNTLQGFRSEIAALLRELRSIMTAESHRKVCKVILYLMIDGTLQSPALGLKIAVAFTRLSLVGASFSQVFDADLDTLAALFEPLTDLHLEQDTQFMLLRSFVALIGKSSAELNEMSIESPIMSLHRSLRKVMR